MTDWYRNGWPRDVGHGRDSDGFLNDCPECGLPVYEHGKELNAPVLWEGRILHGHASCLGQIYRDRDRDDPSIGSRAFSDEEYARELNGGA